MSTSSIVEIILSITMLAAIIGVIVDRIKQKKGIGLRVIQFLAATLLIPASVILGLEKMLSADALATLFGAIAGYILSSITREQESNN